MTIAIEQDVAGSGPAPEQESNPQIGENQPPHDGVCANPRCRKGPNGTRGILKNPRAKYCSNYCRVAVCRQKRKLWVSQLKRKRRSDAKWSSPADRKRDYEEGRMIRRQFFRTYWIPRRDKIH
jgi:hypothetical protein